MNSIKDQLKTGQFSQVQLVYGEERYLVRYYKNAIKKALVADEDTMNLTVFTGDDVELSEVQAIGETLPFFGEQRLIIIEDSGLCKRTNDFAEWLANLPETTYILFVEREVDKRNGLYKFINKSGCVTNAELSTERDLIRWITGYAKKAGKLISNANAQYLIMRVGSHMENLSQELDKLIAYALKEEEITKEAIDLLCVQQLNDVIFAMIEAVANRNQAEAMKLYRDLLLQKESPRKINALFVRQFSILLQLKEWMTKNISKNDMADKVGVHPYFIGKYIAQCKKFSYNELKEMVNECAQTIEDANFGRINDQIAIEMFIIRYSQAV